MDSTFVKGFRTSAVYFPETAYGTYSITSTKAYRIGGKVKGINWTAKQNLIKTGNVGDGRNYKQQLYGTYDANASINWEVSDFIFLRFALGDIAKWNNDGNDAASPFFFVDSELTGVDSSSGANTALLGTNVDGYSSIRLRPFSMLLYDAENSASGSVYAESVDRLLGCMMNDFSLSASIGTPVTSSTNLVVKEIQFKKNISAVPGNVPDFTSTTSTLSSDYGNTVALDNETSYNLSQEPPLMFYEGQMNYGGTKLALVQSFNMSVNNGFRVYREVTDRFILMPTTGMRAFTLTANMLFEIPAVGDTAGQGSILEIIKNYMGYASDATLSSSTILAPAQSSESGAPEISTPQNIEKDVTLVFGSTDLSGNARGATITLHKLVPEGFGHPVQYENGLVEIPITFSVRGYPYNKAGDGSYSGWDGSSTSSTFASTGFHPIIQFYLTET